MGVYSPAIGQQTLDGSRFLDDGRCHEWSDGWRSAGLPMLRPSRHPAKARIRAPQRGWIPLLLVRGMSR